MNSRCSFKTTNNRYKTTHNMKNNSPLAAEINLLLEMFEKLEAKRGFRNSLQLRRQIDLQYLQLKNKYRLLILYEGPKTESGKPDKRTRAGKRFYIHNPTFEFMGPLKADLSPDKRSKEWKAFVRGGKGGRGRERGRTTTMPKEMLPTFVKLLREDSKELLLRIHDYLEDKLNKERENVKRIYKSKKKLTTEERKRGIKEGNEKKEKLKEELKALSG